MDTNRFVAKFLGRFATIPLMRRFAWHTRRIRGSLDRRFFLALAKGGLIFVLMAATLVTVIEKPWTTGLGATVEWLGRSINWAVFTVLGKGDATYVKTAGGYVVGWLLVLFGVAIVGTITGALVAVVIDFMLKEGQGMGASGYAGHVVVCGWNTTARDLIDELRSDDYKAQIVLLHNVDRNPAGDGVYFVKGDPTNVPDLQRAGIEEAASALVFPSDDGNEADMRSILTVMAIESIAPGVRTVVEANNPRHVEHLRRAKADEVLVTSTLASHLLARSALYPGVSALVTDIVSGGVGSELYRVTVPDAYLGLSIDAVSARFREEHRATLLAVGRGARTIVNPPTDFRFEAGDDALVVAESLGTLAPLRLESTATEAIGDEVPFGGSVPGAVPVASSPAPAVASPPPIPDPPGIADTTVVARSSLAPVASPNGSNGIHDATSKNGSATTTDARVKEAVPTVRTKSKKHAGKKGSR